MSDNTKTTTEQSLFVSVRDSNTGRIKRIAVPSDMQVGLKDNPAELQLLGRLSLSGADYGATNKNKGKLYINSNDTIVSVSTVVTPVSGRVSVYLPGNPRDGQLHFIKDVSGTALTVPIDIFPASNTRIDSSTSKSLTSAYESLALYWFGDRWRVLVASVASGSGSSSTSTYITLTNDPSLTRERRLNLSGSNISMDDQGANASVILDLTPILGGGAGTYTYSTVTVDQYGRITAVSSGAAPPAMNSSFLTVTNEPALSDERALVLSTGLKSVDGGANAALTVTINDNITATVSGTQFSGPVVANNGLTGSIQKVASGLSYLVGAGNVSIFSQSNGQIIISGSGTSSGGAGGSSTTLAAYDAYYTGSVTWGNVTAWSDFTNIVNPLTIQEPIKTGINRSGSTFTVEQTGYYKWSSNFNTNVSTAGYISFRLSGSAGTLLQHSIYDQPAAAHGMKLDGVIYLSSGSSFRLQYVTKTGTRSTWNVNDPIGTAPDTENMVIGRMSMFLLGVGSSVISSSFKAFPRYHDTMFSPVGLWQLSGTLGDSSGNAYDFTLGAGSTLYGPMAPGMLGFAFNGASMLQTAVAPANLLLTGAMTLEMILSPSRQNSSEQYIADFGGTGESYATNYLYSVLLGANTNAISYLCESGSGGTNVLFTTSGSLQLAPLPVHLAMVRDSQHQVKFYLNGEQVSSGSSGLANPSFTAPHTGRFYLGATDNAALFYQGSVASVKIIASALTPAQVWREFEYTLGPLYGIAAGSDAAASYIVLSATSSLQNERVLSGSGIGITDNGAGSTVVLSTLKTGSLPRYHDTTFSPVGLWQLSGSLLDSSGNNNHLTRSAGTTNYTTIAPGMLAGYYNGSTIHQAPTTFQTVGLITGSMTVELITIPSRIATVDSRIVAEQGTLAAETYQTNVLWAIDVMTGDNNLRYAAESGSAGANAIYETSHCVIPGGMPLHLALVRDASHQVVFYVNGDAVTSSSSGLINASYAPTPTIRLEIGGGTGAAAGYAGAIASVKVMSSSLTPQQVRQEFLYTLGPMYGF